MSSAIGFSEQGVVMIPIGAIVLVVAMAVVAIVFLRTRRSEGRGRGPFQDLGPPPRGGDGTIRRPPPPGGCIPKRCRSKRCRKCGHEHVLPNWPRATFCTGCKLVDGEHLHRDCLICKATWIERCDDSEGVDAASDIPASDSPSTQAAEPKEQQLAKGCVIFSAAMLLADFARQTNADHADIALLTCRVNDQVEAMLRNERANEPAKVGADAEARAQGFVSDLHRRMHGAFK